MIYSLEMWVNHSHSVIYWITEQIWHFIHCELFWKVAEHSVDLILCCLPLVYKYLKWERKNVVNIKEHLFEILSLKEDLMQIIVRSFFVALQVLKCRKCWRNSGRNSLVLLLENTSNLWRVSNDRYLRAKRISQIYWESSCAKTCTSDLTGEKGKGNISVFL